MPPASREETLLHHGHSCRETRISRSVEATLRRSDRSTVRRLRVVATPLVVALLAPAPVDSSAAVPAASEPGPAPALRAPEAWIERETRAMGTSLRIRVAAADRATALRASEAGFRAVERAEARLSTWRAETDLAALNAAPVDRVVRVERPLLELLEEVRRWSGETGGTFDPAVGALVDAWGLRGDGRRPSHGELERARVSTGLRCFELDTRAGEARRLCPDAWLDAGAFGKGAALREARVALEVAGARAALLDFGGQQLAFGAPEEGDAWILGVAHPRRRDEPVLRIRVAAGSAATTGQSERAVETPDGRVGHVLDPRTGRPVPAWGSVTVVADDPLVADLLSTALFVMGPSAGIEWLRDRPEIAALFLVEEANGLSVRATEALRPMLLEASLVDGARPRT